MPGTKKENDYKAMGDNLVTDLIASLRKDISPLTTRLLSPLFMCEFLFLLSSALMGRFVIGSEGVLFL